MSPPDAPLLTPRQLEVLELMAKGLPNREIAGVLGIAPATVKRHVSSVIEALDVTNRTEAATRLHELGLGAGGPPQGEYTVPGFGERQAIAVLPFDNLSSDPEQAFLADGIVEDLTTRLAGWRWFPVISRNSTFVYKGRAVDVRQASQDLGARYVVEGSVRRVGSRVRITVQLLDGPSAQHLWAQHYDRELADVFAVEDEIVDTLVATLEPALLKLGGLRVLSREPEQLDAWESTQRGFVHAMENTWDGFCRAQPFFERAMELDPRHSTASVLSAYCLMQLLLMGRAPEPLAALARLGELARRVHARDPDDPFASLGIGWSHMLARERAEGLAAFERGLELGPSVAWLHVSRAFALNANGRAEEGCEAARRAARLSPQDPLGYFFDIALGTCLTTVPRFDEAEEAFRRCVRRTPDQPHAYGGLVACHMARDEIDEAAALVARIRTLDPDYDPLMPVRIFMPPDVADLATAMYARAGWPGASAS